MATLDAEIDRLYQLPIAEFTPARNALAKRAGARAAEIRALHKAGAAAWAVNQLYWRRRDVFKALAAASDARRQAHVKRLVGKAAALESVDGRYRAALNVAIKTTLDLLTETSEKVSPTTVAAITQTLEAVPSPEVRGRLARPLEPPGLSVLVGLMAAEPASAASPAPSSAGGDGRERVRIAHDLRAAQEAEHDAAEALAKARDAVHRAGEEIERLEHQLREARATAEIRRDEVEARIASANDAAAIRIRLERRLQEIP